MSILERCPSYRESNKGSKERQGPTLSVHFTEVSVKGESTVQTIPGQSILGSGLTNLVESRYVKKERALLLVDMRYLKTPLLKLPSINWVSV